MIRFTLSRRHLGHSLLLLLLLHCSTSTCHSTNEATTKSEAKQTKPLYLNVNAMTRRQRLVEFGWLTGGRSSGIHGCGGVLIRPQWVATAAHCVDPSLTESLGRNPVVHCGIHKLDSEKGELLSAEATYLHKFWTGNHKDGYDFALLKLKDKTKIPLPSVDIQGGHFKNGSTFTALGWGKNEDGLLPNALQVAEMVYVDPEACKEVYISQVTNHTICAGFDQNACEGDSGGPLIVPNAPSRNVFAGDPTIDQVIGITSAGPDDCADGYPTLYTSIGSVWDWVLETIGESSSPSSCPVSCPDPSDLEEVCRNYCDGEKGDEETIETERKRLRNLTEKELLYEAFMSTVDDNALTLEAALEKGLHPDANYGDGYSSDYPLVAQSTLLHCSAAYNASTCAKILVNRDADVNSVNAASLTPLHIAAMTGSASVAKILLDAEADTDLADDMGATALHIAARKGHTTIAKMLMSKGADLEALDDSDQTPLHEAVNNGHVGMVKVLLDFGAETDAAEKGGNTPLHIAAHYGHTSIVKLLLRDGADVDAIDDEAWTALHTASRFGHVEIAKILLDHDADVDAVKANSWNALHLASRYGHAKIVKDLLQHGADVNAAKNDGWTAMHLAILGKHIEVVKILIDEGADFDKVTESGHTPLHTAAGFGLLNIVKVLLDAGASKTVTDVDGLTPLDVVCAEHHIICSEETRTSIRKLLSP